MRFGLFYVLESTDGDYRRAWEEMLERIGGLEHAKVMRSLELFAEQVMPQVEPLEPNVPQGLRSGD